MQVSLYVRIFYPVNIRHTDKAKILIIRNKYSFDIYICKEIYNVEFF